MIRFHPIASGAPWDDADKADLRAFDWETSTAEFVMRDDARVLRVYFDRYVIVRMLDEFPLCTEDGAGDWEGLIPHHFAYRVEGHPFFEAQSDAWKDVFSPQHYRFLTGSGCLDVLSPNPPLFEIALRQDPNNRS